MRRNRRWMEIAVVLMLLGHAAAARAEEGFIAGADIGVAVPVDRFSDREDIGGTLSPFAGYMFGDYFGAVASAQVSGFPNVERPAQQDSEVWALAGLGGPRLALPFSLGSTGFELYGTWQGGVFTGLTSHTPISRTSWGYSTGLGFNVRVTDDLLVGVFGRYNWLDQRVQGHDVQYVTAGLSLTYNAAPPPPPPPPAPVAKAKRAPTPKKKIVLRGVRFDFDKAVIRPDARPVLDEAVATLKKEGGIAVIAEGHTDSVGSDSYNKKLSEQRAQAVRDYLVKGGIAASRIRVEGLGESRPVASNDTEDGRAQNRRVELRIRGN